MRNQGKNIDQGYEYILIFFLFLMKSIIIVLKMSNVEHNLHHYYLERPTNYYEISPSPKHSRTGSNFTKFKSNHSNRSKYSSNSKLLKSSLFKILKKGNSDFMENIREQKNLQAQLLTEMSNNLSKEQTNLKLRIGSHFTLYASYGMKGVEDLLKC